MTDGDKEEGQSGAPIKANLTKEQIEVLHRLAETSAASAASIALLMHTAIVATDEEYEQARTRACRDVDEFLKGIDETRRMMSEAKS